MLSISSTHQFVLYKPSCDMRKSFNSLCGLVHNELKLTAHDGSVYIIINKKRNQMKLLHWETGGFVLYHKRLEQGTFALPMDNKSIITWSTLVLMIEGVEVIKRSQKKRFLLK
ncbi:IS66 family insertion sequence element accessory protein TnpB [Myroides pelagicus]|uniref:IS66 family insertion sequence element accessory protein TnpB n=1 Tax=Myroides pelagicus TaxID=270914 RepID=UPI002DBE96C8|nr:IS66 family insertion sequence element accessory protein TnpB [Myroides pelagicus]MEC4114962.1 IS66 family insertion sequence element accessory protein TnpB [Myroides pelagicus]